MNFICKITLLTFFLLQPAFATTKFLTVSDIHYGYNNISKDGQDTGPEFLKITLDKIKELSKTVDFILFLGDLPTHSLFPNPNKEYYEKIVFHGLYESDVDAKPMFYITGNNDSLIGNYQAFESKGISPLTYALDWNGACVHCQGLMIDSSHMNQHGYYSSYVIPQNTEMILIALNATEWAQIPGLKRAFFGKYPHQEEDALQQLEWLEQQLKNHHAKQLLIAMHEPPGYSYIGEPIWYEQYVQGFIKLLNKYNHLYEQITLLSSHTHMEEFRKIKLNTGKNIYIYSTPGISRNHHNYPGMKIFTLNNELKIKNFTTYYTSDLHSWGSEQYYALGMSDSIFPNCQNKTLSQCLDHLNEDQVCDNLKHGAFYGVKNPLVIDRSCKNTYPVN